MKTSRIVLRHARPEDYPRLHEIESDPETQSAWRYRGPVPPLAQYEAALWKQTDAVLVVANRSDDLVVGYLHLYDVNVRAGHGWFSLYAGPQHRGRGTVMEGLMLFCDWVFGNTSLRWIYAHSFDGNLDQFKSGIRRGEAHHLGTLRQRVVVDGNPTDVHVIGIERNNWLESPLRTRLHRLQQRIDE